MQLASQLTTAELQAHIRAHGYQYLEHVFPEGDTYIKFSRSRSPFAFDIGAPEYDVPLAWGRFERRWAWEQAYNQIVLGTPDRNVGWKLL